MNYIDIKTNNVLDFKIVNEPYLIKNYAKDWYAYKNWSFEYIKNLNANLLVNTVDGYLTENMKIIACKLSDYIAKITSNETNAYLTMFHLFKAFPNLRKHVEYKDIKKNSIYLNLLSWIGPKGAFTGFHCDWSQNINISIKGKKLWYLVSPEYNDNMYPLKKFERGSTLSPVDIRNLDENKFPLFKKAKVMKVIVEEGDAIYIPKGWWHTTLSLTPTINVSFHYWSLFNFFRYLIPEGVGLIFHQMGLYKKNNCACHTYNDKGERVARSTLFQTFGN